MATSRLPRYPEMSPSVPPSALPPLPRWGGLWARLRKRLPYRRPGADPWRQAAGTLWDMDDHQLSDIGAPAWLRAMASERRARLAWPLRHGHRLHL